MAVNYFPKVWHNGKFIPWDEATIHVASHVVSYASCLFEGVRCYETPQGPSIFRLKEHTDRLVNSCKIYRMSHERIGFRERRAYPGFQIPAQQRARAMQARLHRFLRKAQALRRLNRAQTFHFAKHEHRAICFRQAFHGIRRRPRGCTTGARASGRPSRGPTGRRPPSARRGPYR